MKVTIRMAVAMTCAILAWGVVGRGVGLPTDSAVAVGAEGAKEGAPKDPAPKDASKRKDANAETRKILEEMTEVDFKEVPLAEAMNYLSDKHRVSIYIDRRSLTEHGTTTDTPVTINMKEKPLRLALELMFRELGLGYTIRDGLIVVATEKDARPRMETRVYRVLEDEASELAGLITATIDFQSWRDAGPFSVAPTPESPGGGGFGRGGFGGGAFSVADSPAPPVELGTVRVFRGALVITQFPEVHTKIERLLADLRPILGNEDQAPSRRPVKDRRDPFGE